MGEIADMMLEGEMCQCCGEFIEPAAGFPTFCAGCQLVHGIDSFGEKKRSRKKKVRGKRMEQSNGG